MPLAITHWISPWCCVPDFMLPSSHTTVNDLYKCCPRELSARMKTPCVPCPVSSHLPFGAVEHLKCG